MSRIVESDTNCSTVEVTWEPPGSGSRVDIYHYQVVVDLEGTSYTLYDVNTTNINTTMILSHSPYDVNVSFVLSANNCEGRSAPTTLILNNVIISKYKS